MSEQAVKPALSQKALEAQQAESYRDYKSFWSLFQFLSKVFLR